MITVMRREGGRTYWCQASRKKTTSYQDSIAVACGGFVILPLGISDSQNVTCPDCLARKARSQ